MRLKAAVAGAEKVGLHEEAPGMLGEDVMEKEEPLPQKSFEKL